MDIRACAVRAALVFGFLSAGAAPAAIDMHQSPATGGGTQSNAALFTPVSNTMVSQIPRFSAALGTLTQADFEFAASASASWLATSGTGTVSLSLSGPTDVGGQAMGPLALNFTGPIDNIQSSTAGDGNATTITFTSGAFFNSLTGVGTVPVSWVYAGNTQVSVPATGTAGFDWQGISHVVYTYDPVPEPAGLMGVGVAGLMMGRRRVRAATIRAKAR